MKLYREARVPILSHYLTLKAADLAIESAAFACAGAVRADRILGRGPPAPSRAAESGKEALGLLGQRAANVCPLGIIGHSRRRESLSVMSVASRVLDRVRKGKRALGRYVILADI